MLSHAHLSGLQTSDRRANMSSCRFLFANGVVLPPSDTPSVSTFLEAHPGAYTTSRTHNNGSLVLFWERHLRRLADSARILLNSNPGFFFESEKSTVLYSSLSVQSSLWDSVIQSLINDSMSKVLPVALKERKSGEELAITALVSGNSEKLSDNDTLTEDKLSRILDVYVHVGIHIPLVFGIQENGAHLAVVGRGRDVANAKYSDWVRLRKPLEKLRLPLVTELLLSNDRDRILEGCVTNFFVVCRKGNNDISNDAKGKDLYDYRSAYSVEIRTAPISDGVLPGVIRQVIIDACSSIGIPLREVAPSWSEREIWEEAFMTNSLRLLQHVETIRVPSSWELLESKSWKEVTWEEKRFKEGPGRITAVVQRNERRPGFQNGLKLLKLEKMKMARKMQKEILKKAGFEGYPVTSFNG